MTTEERLERVEGQLRHVRWFNGFLVACIALGIGAWGLAKSLQPETALAGTGIREIRARRFVLEDLNGKARGGLEMLPPGAMLWLWDKNQNVCTGLGETKNGSRLTLFDEKGNARISLSVNKKGPALAIYDENGKVIWHAP